MCPPIIWGKAKSLKNILRKVQESSPVPAARLIAIDPTGQDLGIYWNPEMAELLDTWGLGNVWNEIQLLLVNCSGRVFDIACGTGKAMEVLSKYPALDLYGCDISDLLISKAIQRGLPQSHLVVTDATQTPYANDHFDYAYSIGSLEHFTEEGIGKFLVECRRITARTSFHQIPISKSGTDEGWVSDFQSYYNNSVDWWLKKFEAVYPSVHVLDSCWSGDTSFGKWFICSKEAAIDSAGIAVRTCRQQPLPSRGSS